MDSVLKGKNLIIYITEPHVFSIIVIQLSHLLVDLIYQLEYIIQLLQVFLHCDVILMSVQQNIYVLIFLLILETSAFFFLSRMDAGNCFPYSVKVFQYHPREVLWNFHLENDHQSIYFFVLSQDLDNVCRHDLHFENHLSNLDSPY